MRFTARAGLWAGGGVLLTAASGTALYAHVMGQEPPRYSCAAAVRVAGSPLPGEVGLVKCYVKAIRTHDQRLLAKVTAPSAAAALPSPAVSGDAAASATFFDYDAGMSDQRVTIAFDDGPKVTLRLGEAPSDLDPPAWRLEPTP